MTAGHTIRHAASDGSPCVCYSDGRRWEGVRFAEYEVIKEYDLGLFLAPVPQAKPMAWRFEELPKLETVQTVGFPHGFEGSQIITRAFRGEIVSGRVWSGLSTNPRVYELSFVCPRSLSGAPLFTTEMNPSVVGTVDGNVITTMTVYKETERLVENGRETIREMTEALHLGLAIQSGVVAQVRSSLLGNTVGEWLRQKGLVR